MPEIIIAVQNKLPILAGAVQHIVADNSDYTVRFSFDEQWGEGTKTVYFIRSNGYAYEPVKTVDDTVSVPVQHDAGLMTRLLIGVQQGDVKTSRPCAVAVYPAVTDMIEDDAVQPDPSLWESFMKRLEQLEKKLDKQQGIENAGKLMFVGEDGEIIPLALGAGLTIKDGVLMIVNAVVTAAICGRFKCGEVVCGGTK